MTLERLRQLLGPQADGMTDRELEQKLREVDVVARAAVEVMAAILRNDPREMPDSDQVN